MNEPHVKWQAPEYEHHKKSVDWFWSVGLIGLASATLAIILNNVLFGIFIIVGTVALILQTLRHPLTREHKIDDIGVHVGDTLYPFNTLDSFWISSTQTSDIRLLIKSQKLLMPLISIPLGEENPDLVREILLEFIDEEELSEPITQILMERLGF